MSGWHCRRSSMSNINLINLMVAMLSQFYCMNINVHTLQVHIHLIGGGGGAFLVLLSEYRY